MKYLIHAHDELDQLIEGKLSNELARFDIRAEVVSANTPKMAIDQLKNSSFDAFIQIGPHSNRKLERICKKQNIKTCFLYQSITSEKPTSMKEYREANKIYSDIPGIGGTMYLGNALINVFKSYALDHFEEVSARNPQLVVIGNRDNPINLLKKRLVELFPKYKIEKAGLEDGLEVLMKVVSKSNAAVVTENIGELLALHLNCPSVRVNKQGFLRKKQYSLINALSKKEIISVFSKKKTDLLKEEILNILNDHNYCAGMMQDYQGTKEILGSEPAIRNIARDLIEWLEEND